jgi:hypothetical protein
MSLPPFSIVRAPTALPPLEEDRFSEAEGWQGVPRDVGPSASAAEPVSSRIVKIAELRRALEEKFPAAPGKRDTHLLTGVEAIDRERGLPRAAVTEISGSTGAGSLLIASLIRAASRARSYAGLVDAGRSFDTLDLEPKVLKRLLWVLCADAPQAVKAADLLLRDGNLPLLLLDLQLVPLAQLRRIPVNTWHRFHRVAEQGNAALVVLTPRPMVEGVKVRIVAGNRWPLEAMTRRRRLLAEDLDLKIFDKRTFFSTLDRQLKTDGEGEEAASSQPAWKTA